MQKQTNATKIDEPTKKFRELAGLGSKTAIGILLVRFAESQRPEGERLFYDPYAIHFISPAILEWQVNNPEKAKQTREERERLVPGFSNSISARVRFFDDFVKKAIDGGLEQLVILGAGYDSRAYRMEELKAIKVFEVDHPETQAVKMDKIKKILGCLPDHVTCVPIDFGTEDLCQKLMEKEYDRSRKSLFLMEGLLYYLPPEAVDRILYFIVENSAKGSEILFDYFHDSLFERNSTFEAGKIFRNFLEQIGEPLLFGIKEGKVEEFLIERGFSKVRIVTSEDYKRAYFHGINGDRTVSSLLSFAHAVVE